jgi:hypothetical protein
MLIEMGWREWYRMWNWRDQGVRMKIDGIVEILESEQRRLE